jgi:hypothetical protein
MNQSNTRPQQNAPADTVDGSPDSTSLSVIEEQADTSIRRVSHEGRMFFSVIDVIGLLTNSANPGVYWRVLKSRLIAEGSDETVTKCNRLKLRAADGKMRETDAGDLETMLRIIQSVPSPKAEPLTLSRMDPGASRGTHRAPQRVRPRRACPAP